MVGFLVLCGLALLIFLVYYNFWRLPRNPFWPRILMYHNTSDEPPCGMNISPQKLEKHIQYLLAKGYTFLKISDLISFDEAKKHVVLTFDDGFVGNYTHLFELLKRYDVPATIYLAPKIKDMRALSADHVKEMQMSGLVEFGAHTMTHVNLEKTDDKLAQKEITKSKEAVEELTGVSCFSFAYPYGRYNERHVEMVRDAGFTTAVTTKKAIAPFDILSPYTLPRLSINGCINRIQFYLILSRGRYKL